MLMIGNKKASPILLKAAYSLHLWMQPRCPCSFSLRFDDIPGSMVFRYIYNQLGVFSAYKSKLLLKFFVFCDVSIT